MQSAAPGVDPFIGTTVASELRTGVVYRIERRLGDGGTAIAYFASRFGPEGTSPAVLKIIQPAIIAKAGELAEMVVKKESVALGRINERVPPCPSVVRLLDSGSLEYGGRGTSMRLPWLALEYVHGGPEGVTLEDRVQYAIREMGYAFGPERAIQFLEQLADGLTEIHAAGVIHRDLNPNNLLCCGSGVSEMFKVSDFGIARPLGMQATFGSEGVGTPGYMAPEQLGGDGEVTFAADIFSAGALIYFVLTGEDLFQGGLMAMVAAKNPARRSLGESKHLAPEIRADPEIVAGLDAALSVATSPNPSLRPDTPRALAASLKSWLQSCPPTRRTHVPTGPAPAPTLPRWVFATRHPPEQRWLLLRLGWDSDGHCLAATTDGLVYFDGTAWNQVPSHGLGGMRPVRFVASAGAGRWLIGGDGGVIAEYTRTGITRMLRSDDAGLTLNDASGELSDLAVAIAGKPGSPPLLAGISGERWLKPLPVPSAASLTDLCRIDDTRWLVVGRSVSGHALAGIYSPLRFELELMPELATRALVSCSSRPERELGVAVGSQGAVVRVEKGNRQVGQVPEGPDLASVTVDVLGSAWAGGAGCLWLGGGADGGWIKAWSNADWHAPFVSIFAEPGLVVAAAADGAVLEGRISGERQSGGGWPAVRP